jgi:hypothetical protein
LTPPARSYPPKTFPAALAPGRELTTEQALRAALDPG